MSGHIFFGERWYGFDDATYTAARLLEILSRVTPTRARCSTRCPPASARPS
jgi:phosphomannomutase